MNEELFGFPVIEMEDSEPVSGIVFGDMEAYFVPVDVDVNAPRFQHYNVEDGIATECLSDWPIEGEQKLCECGRYRLHRKVRA